MEVKVKESFLLGGEHQEAGSIIEVSEQDALRLKQMGRVTSPDGEEAPQDSAAAAIDKMKKEELLDLAVKLDVTIPDKTPVAELKEILKAKVAEV